MRMTALLSMMLLAGFSGIAEADTEADAAEALSEKMLSAIGGRQAWAGLRNTINGSQQNRVGEPTTVYAVITMDFERPRFRIETTAPGFHTARVINGKNSWRQGRDGTVADVDEDFYAEEMSWYASHLYRTIHRVAARDPALTLAIGDNERLEVYQGDQRLRWFQLDATGVPYRFGSFDDEVGAISGPWDFVQDGIHHPAWVSNADGTWRAAVRSLSVNVPLREHTFARP